MNQIDKVTVNGQVYVPEPKPVKNPFIGAKLGDRFECTCETKQWNFTVKKLQDRVFALMVDNPQSVNAIVAYGCVGHTVEKLIENLGIAINKPYNYIYEWEK